MIKNLVVSGCSFTAGSNSWPNFIQEYFGIKNLYNIGASGAGNAYIASSLIDFFDHNLLDPADTLVLAMWSGPGRIDKMVSGEYWYLLDNYPGKAQYENQPNSDIGSYWIFSGGHSNSWQDYNETVKLFRHDYISTDPTVLCKNTLDNVFRLENFLKNKNIRYKFMSYVNLWNANNNSAGTHDFSISYFCNKLPIMSKINFDSWIFANEKKDCIYEFCKDRSLLSDDLFHPSKKGHEIFAQSVVMPSLMSFNF